MDVNKICLELKESIENGNAEQASKLTIELINLNYTPLDIINNCLIPAMNTVGDKFAKLELFLPEVIMAAEAFESSLKHIEPLISASQKEKITVGKVVIGTIQGDIHDLGKNIVAMMLRAHGFEVIDLGRDVPVDLFVKKAIEINADIIAISALMSTSLPYVRDVIKLLKEKGLREKFIVMVGGGAVTREWAQEVGTDGYGEHFEEAVYVAKKLIDEKKKSAK
jgi:corrinoid protein of di/trimethylamine methyltransferase